MRAEITCESMEKNSFMEHSHKHFDLFDTLYLFRCFKKNWGKTVSSCGTVQMMDAELLGPLLLMNGQSWGSSKVLMLSQHLSASSCCVWIASPAERWKHASQGGGHMPHVASVPQRPLSLWEICHLAFPIFSSLTLFPSITVRQHWVLQSRMQSSAISSLMAGPGYLSWVLILIFRTSLVPSLFYSCFLLRGIKVPLLSKLLIDPWGRKCVFCNDMYCATSHLECCRATILATSYFAGSEMEKCLSFLVYL